MKKNYKNNSQNKTQMKLGLQSPNQHKIQQKMQSFTSNSIRYKGKQWLNLSRRDPLHRTSWNPPTEGRILDSSEPQGRLLFLLSSRKKSPKPSNSPPSRLEPAVVVFIGPLVSCRNPPEPVAKLGSPKSKYSKIQNYWCSLAFKIQSQPTKCFAAPKPLFHKKPVTILQYLSHWGNIVCQTHCCILKHLLFASDHKLITNSYAPIYLKPLDGQNYDVHQTQITLYLGVHQHAQREQIKPLKGPCSTLLTPNFIN